MSIEFPENALSLILELAIDPVSRRYRRLMLSPEAGSLTDGFSTALISPAISVHAGICQNDPNEICVVASGRDTFGKLWRNVPIVILDPEWDRDAELAQSLADDIVELWRVIQSCSAVTAPTQMIRNIQRA